ncbi:MAG TPA: thiamine phosphate synthase [Spirochaetia bacterium]|nr:thiamine phosphate synthase [Spirochaetia bacterium]
MECTLYLVTDSGLLQGRTLVEVVEAALRGGVTAVQYREKSAPTRRMIEEARELRQLCRAAGVPFIVNDRVDVALAVDADGVHVGQDDMPAAVARRLIGKGRILGVSAVDAEEARRAEADGADYIGASPIFATPTKPDAPRPMGVEGLRKLAYAVRVPVVAIGGVNANNAAAMIAAGASGVAVVSAIMAADDAEAAARAIRMAVEKWG